MHLSIHKCRVGLHIALLTLLVLGGCKTFDDQSQVKDLATSLPDHECSLSDFFGPGVTASQPNLNNIPWDVVLSNAMLSTLAYEDRATVQKTAKKWHFDKFDAADQGGLASYVISNDKCVILFFRGTDDIKDWMTNGQILGTDVDHGRMHSGFSAAFASIRQQIYAHLSTQVGPNKHFWVSGHSLGGALAAVFAHDYATHPKKPGFPDIEYLVTFGQPYLADQELANFMNLKYGARYFRVVNNKDIVTKIPPGYVHFGSLVWLKNQELVFNWHGPTAVAASAAPAGVQGDGSRDVGQPEAVTLEEPDALSQDEFEAFMNNQASGLQLSGPHPNNNASSGPSSSSTSAGSLADHSMYKYIDHIHSLYGGPANNYNH